MASSSSQDNSIYNNSETYEKPIISQGNDAINAEIE